MKKKGHRDVPDFSRQRPQRGEAAPDAPSGTPGTPRRPAPAQPRPSVKPQATSSKSGRRGQ